MDRLWGIYAFWTRLFEFGSSPQDVTHINQVQVITTSRKKILLTEDVEKYLTLS